MRRNPIIGKNFKHPVKQICERSCEPWAVPRRLHAIDRVRVLFIKRVEKRAEDFRRFLKIDIDEENQIAFGVLQPAHHRFVVAKITRQIHHQDASILFLQIQGSLQRAVGRAVVNENKFQSRRNLLSFRPHPTIEFIDVGSGLEQGRDDRKLHRRELSLDERDFG